MKFSDIVTKALMWNMDPNTPKDAKMKIETYCTNTNPANAISVTLGDSLKVWFSYQTCVAVQSHGRTIVCENAWGPTTGKHLNAIDGGGAEAKALRFPQDKFLAWLKVMEQAGMREAADSLQNESRSHAITRA